MKPKQKGGSMRHVLVRIALVVLISLVWIAVALVLFWPSLCAAENTKSKYRAWLEMKKVDDVTRINLVCENLTDRDATLQFSFFIEIIGPNGRSSSQQSGTVRIKAGQKGIIARARVSVPPGFCKVSMAVYKDGNLVAEDEKIYPGISAGNPAEIFLYKKAAVRFLIGGYRLK